jgi:hypothetical protein
MAIQALKRKASNVYQCQNTRLVAFKSARDVAKGFCDLQLAALLVRQRKHKLLPALSFFLLQLDVLFLLNLGNRTEAQVALVPNLDAPQSASIQSTSIQDG